METCQRKKLEILIEDVYKSPILKILDKYKVTGYACLPVSAGKGYGQYGNADFIAHLDSVCILVMVRPEIEHQILNEISPIIQEAEGIVLVSDISIIRSDKN